MSARDEALGPMQRDMLGELRRRYDTETAEAGLLALREEIARELAEKIRGNARSIRASEVERFGSTDYESDLQHGARMADADLIDPDKED